MDFYLYLPSNTGDYIDNTLSSFKVKLPNKVDLDGQWEVALVEIGYPITWFNVSCEDEGLVSIAFKDKDEHRSKSIPFNNYNTINSLCNAINYTLDHMHSFSGERASFNFSYDSIMHRVVLKPINESGEPNVSLIRLSPQLQYMLGFKNQVVSPLEGKVEILFTDKKEAKTASVLLANIKWSTKSDDEDASMFEYLNNILSGLAGDERVELMYFPETSEIKLNGKNVMHVKFSENVQYRLGLTHDVIYPAGSYKVKERAFMRPPTNLIMAGGAPDVRAGQYSLFIYCDVVRPQIVGNALAPILRAVSIRGKFGDVVDELYDNPHYVPIIKKEFGSIEINISDDRGRLVDFEYGKLFVKLHFRMKL